MFNRYLLATLGLVLSGCAAAPEPGSSSESSVQSQQSVAPVSSTPAPSSSSQTSIAISSDGGDNGGVNTGGTSSESVSSESVSSAAPSSSSLPLSSSSVPPVISSSSTPPTASDCSDAVAEGEGKYADSCAACHGADVNSGITSGGFGGVIDPTEGVWGKNNVTVPLVEYVYSDMLKGGCDEACADKVVAYLTHEAGVGWCPTVATSSSSSSSSQAPVVPAVAVPARIESEDFIAYEDTTPENLDTCGDQNQPVDLQPKSAGGGTCDVNWTAEGEWLEYKIDVAEDAVFDIAVSLAAFVSANTVTVSIDAVPVGTVNAPTQGWTTFVNQTIAAIALDAGEHRVRVTFDKGGVNFDAITFTENATGGIVGDIARGEDLYYNDKVIDCSGCHGDSGEGTSPTTMLFSSIDEYIVDGQVVDKAGYIKLTMPTFNPGSCGSQCSADLAAFIKSKNWNPDGPEAPVMCEAGGDSNAHPNSPLRMLTRYQLAFLIKDTFSAIPITAQNIIDDLTPDVGLARFSTNYGAAADTAQVSALKNWAENLGPRIANNYSKFMSCDMNNDSCVENFAKQYGRLLYRRTLTTAEMAVYKDIISAASDGRDAVKSVTLAMLLAPQTLYEMYEQVDQRTKLSGTQIASKLAFLIWDRAPDDALITAAEQADAFSTNAKIAEQARKMLADERAKNGIRFFYENWMAVNIEIEGGGSSTVTIDDLKGECGSTAQCQTKYGNADDCSVNNLGGVCLCNGEACGLANAGTTGGIDFATAKKEIGRFASYLTLEQNAPLSDIFASTTSIVDPELAELYGVTTQGKPMYDGGYVVDLNAERRSGIATRAAVMYVGGDHEASPITGRGYKIRSSLLCDPPPEPPADVADQFPKLPPDYDKTLRQKLEEVHLSVGGSCQGCHELMDPIGFMFENYDGNGAFRTEYHLVDEEGNGPDIYVPVDPTGYLVEANKALDLPKDFDNAVEFSQALANSEAAAQCFSDTWFERSFGRNISQDDICSADAVFARFKQSNYSLQEMIIAIVTDSNFRFRNPDPSN